jgi:hypothetical protein
MRRRPLRSIQNITCAVLLACVFPLPLSHADGAVPDRINVFQQRLIAVETFENTGDARYSSLSDVFSSSFYTYALTVSTITLSDEERSFLQSLSVEEGYKDAFAEAGEQIRYRLAPKVVMGKGDEGAFPLSIHGFFRVDPAGRDEGDVETVRLTALAYNTMTRRTDVEYTLDRPLADILRQPESYLVPFFRELLRYRAFTATILAEPEDALIYIDERLVGVGRAREVLIPSGPHRLGVKRRGFRDYTALFSAEKDGTVTAVKLAALEKTRALRFVSSPEGAELYIDERFAGLTPVEVLTSGEERSFIFVKEGYRHRLLTHLDIPPGGGEVEVSLIPLNVIEDLSAKAERYRKRANVSYGGGIGMLALAIFFGTQKTLFEQKADLYNGTDPQRYKDALRSARTYGALTAASAAASAGLFTFSFVEMVRYFNLYGSGRTGKPR